MVRLISYTLRYISLYAGVRLVDTKVGYTIQRIGPTRIIFINAMIGLKNNGVQEPYSMFMHNTLWGY